MAEIFFEDSPDRAVRNYKGTHTDTDSGYQQGIAISLYL
ncbi:Uncharacterized protein dnm_020020 [Desulfonema magnum]|uniref:Uncharacterized protein n=1 Tax=Desulfonema magnum TaxID=45655 RepID=A0A975BIM4_9BACT|nr:Uncharacterized protein dnm_020020 [Desulfonema magnum]